MQYRSEITDEDGAIRILSLDGRNAWTLAELFLAEDTGCTPIDNPAPRWSAYVRDLRHECGLSIQTIHESHAGLYPGTHARYLLKTPVWLSAILREPEDA